MDAAWGVDQWLQCGWDEKQADLTKITQCSKVQCAYYCSQMDGCIATETSTRADALGRNHIVCSFSSTCTAETLSQHTSCTAYLANFPQHCETRRSSDCSACEKCLSGFVLQGGTCVQTCEIGWYADTSVNPNRCLHCASGVANCDVCSSKDKCKACEPTFLLSEIVGTSNEYKQCVKTTCPAGTFPEDRDGDGTNERCTKCATGCTTCSAADDCTKCGSDFYRHDSNGDGKYESCAACTCIAEQYKTGTCTGTETELSAVCKDCSGVDPNCLVCEKETECKKCPIGYHLAAQKYLPANYKTQKQGKCSDHGWTIVPQEECQAAALEVGVPASSTMSVLGKQAQKKAVSGCYVDLSGDQLFYNPRTTTRSAAGTQALICKPSGTQPLSKCVECTRGACASTSQYNDMTLCTGTTTTDGACPECSSAMANCVECTDSKHCTKCAAGNHLFGSCETPDTYRRVPVPGASIQIAPKLECVLVL